MTGVIAAIYSSFFLAIAQGALKKSYKELAPSVAFAFDAALGLVLWVPLALIVGVSFGQLHVVSGYAVLSAILSEALYFYALSKGQLSITAVLLGSYPIYTILFSHLVNNDHLSALQAIFVAITIVGTLLTYLPSKFNREELRANAAVIWPLVAAIGIGLSDALSKHVIDATEDFTFLFMLAIVQVPVAWIYLKLEKQTLRPTVDILRSNPRELGDAVAGSLFNIVGTGLLWISFSLTIASIASPITATSGAITALLAVIFLDERVTLRAAVGLIFVLLGVAGITTEMGV